MSYNWNRALFFKMGFFHLAICVRDSSVSFHGLGAGVFLALNDTPLFRCATVCLSTEEHLGCFQILNKDAINIHVQVLVET